MSDWAEEIIKKLWKKWDLHPNCTFDDKINTLPKDLAQALRNAYEQGRRDNASTGCCGKDRVCCYDCWQLQLKAASPNAEPLKEKS